MQGNVVIKTKVIQSPTAHIINGNEHIAIDQLTHCIIDIKALSAVPQISIAITRGDVKTAVDAKFPTKIENKNSTRLLAVNIDKHRPIVINTIVIKNTDLRPIL